MEGGKALNSSMLNPFGHFLGLYQVTNLSQSPTILPFRIRHAFRIYLAPAK